MSLHQLPIELILLISRLLPPPDLNSLVQTSRGFANLLQTHLLSKVFTLRSEEYGKRLLYSLARSRHRSGIRVMVGQGILDFVPQRQLLNTAVKTLEAAAVEFLLDSLGEENAVSFSNVTSRSPLKTAAMRGLLDMVEMFLRRGFGTELSETGCLGPLYMAASYGYVEVVKVMLEHPDVNVNTRSQERTTPLIIAAFKGHEAVVQVLLKDPRIDPNLRDDASATALLKASLRGHAGVVKLLLLEDQLEVNVQDDRGWTALGRAASRGHVEVVRELLEDKRVDVNVGSIGGESSLFVMVRRRSMLDVVRECLADDRFDVCVRDNESKTIMHVAAQFEPTGMVKILLADLRIDVNARDGRGQTPLYTAVDSKSATAVETLLADDRVQVDIGDLDGVGPLERALVMGDREVIRLLLANPKVSKEILLERGIKREVLDGLQSGLLDDEAVEAVLAAGVQRAAGTDRKSVV